MAKVQGGDAQLGIVRTESREGDNSVLILIMGIPISKIKMERMNQFRAEAIHTANIAPKRRATCRQAAKLSCWRQSNLRHFALLNLLGKHIAHQL